MGGQVLEGPILSHREEDGRVVITQAPPISRMSLEMLAERDPAVVKIQGREIKLAGQVTYRVTDWDDQSCCLLLKRVGGGV